MTGAAGREGRASVRRRLILALPLSALLSIAGVAHAQVIEIADDGVARTYDRPTRFVAAGEEDAIDMQVAQGGKQVVTADHFQRAAAAHKVDVGLLRAVAWTESRGRADAVSNKGALGVMQLMPATAAALGVDPRDAASNISGGAAYLAQQIERFGSVPLALAAYNAGPGAVQRWGGIPPYAETRGYVASVLARWHQNVTFPVKSASAALVQAAENTLLIEVSPL